jgi:hypothetical protein
VRWLGAFAIRLFAACVLLYAACTSTQESSEREAKPVELKVMEFNIEYGGHEVDFDSVIEAIERSDADVVAIEEAWGNVPLVAKRLGWDYFDVRTQIVSQFPLLAPQGSDGHYTFIEVEPGRVVAIGNVHLPSAPYGPNKIRTGADANEILALEKRTRLQTVKPFVHALGRLADGGIPVFLVGDFNAPSYRDWTEETVGLRDHIAYPLEWPVSVAVEDAGLEDSYRAVHPDPVNDPGLTWPALRPFVKGYNPARTGAAADRIDFVYAGGPATVLDSVLVGERGGPEVEIPVDPWPTDHRGVLSTFEVTPSIPGTFVAVERRLVKVGQDARVAWISANAKPASVVVLSKDGREVAQRLIDDDSGPSGTELVSTAHWRPGAYTAALNSTDGQELSRVRFWVEAADARPRVSTGKRNYAVRETIDIEWRNAPGNRWDWVGIYKLGADPNVASYLSWFYTEASVEGSSSMNDDAAGDWPLPPGRYSLYLLEDDAYRVLAQDSFNIRR